MNNTTICDRCSCELDEDFAITADDECGEWSGCTLCPDCETEAIKEAKE